MGTMSRTIPCATWLMCTNRDDALLHRAISSCLAQTVQDFELVIVANGIHQQALVESLKKTYGTDPRVVVIGTSVRLLNFALNLGLHVARAPLVARMDADDVAMPNRLAIQLAYFDQRPKLAVLGSAYRLIDACDSDHGIVKLPILHNEIRKAFFFGNPICHPSVMLRRNVVLELGGYLGGQNAEDYDLWLRILMEEKWEIENLADPLISYNVEPNGAARRSLRAYANVAAAQWRNFIVTRDPRWMFGAIWTSAKSAVRANQA